MTHIASRFFRPLWSINVFHPRCSVNLRLFGSAAREEKVAHTPTGKCAESKPSIRDYYSRREIAALFLQPFCIIVAYLLGVWQLFKYICDINSIDEFLRVLRWKYNSYMLSKGNKKGQ